jgi:hypothetical protein
VHSFCDWEQSGVGYLSILVIYNGLMTQNWKFKLKGKQKGHLHDNMGTAGSYEYFRNQKKDLNMMPPI